MVSHSGGREERAGGAKIKIEMLIALFLIPFSSNSPSLGSQREGQEDTRKQEALRSTGRAEDVQADADGHISNFTPQPDQQRRGCGVSSKTNKWKVLRDKMGSNR